MQVRTNSDNILSRLERVEERRGHEPLRSLSPERIAQVKQRLLAEKETILASFERESPLRHRKQHKGNVFRIATATAALMLVAISSVIYRSTLPVESTLAYAKGNILLNEKPVGPATNLHEGESLAAPAGAVAVFDQMQKVFAVVTPNSKILLEESHRRWLRPDVILNQPEGVVFYRVKKGEATLRIRARDAEISVVGTAFAVRQDAGQTTVQVLEGTVAVRSGPGGTTTPGDRKSEPTYLQAGQKTTVYGTTPPKPPLPLTIAESSQLQAYANLVDAVRSGAPELRLQEKANAVLALNTETKTGGKAYLTLAEIKRRYGKISRVSLNDGRSFTGFFTLSGDQMKIITPAGTVRVASQLLKEVRDAD